MASLSSSLLLSDREVDTCSPALFGKTGRVSFSQNRVDPIPAGLAISGFARRFSTGQLSLGERPKKALPRGPLPSLDVDETQKVMRRPRTAESKDEIPIPTPLPRHLPLPSLSLFSELSKDKDDSRLKRSGSLPSVCKRHDRHVRFNFEEIEEFRRSLNRSFEVEDQTAAPTAAATAAVTTTTATAMATATAATPTATARA
eukprot:TRINITY_DN9508_c2_g1_i1.p1 TRINITY_DN9508_c2_g1~~TRINITY_DN9508_c2_g1_i1.p1  ORF type:complete len:216 (-),score=46.96 TRINITY_DN9508_c2_g1_i1:59-661(-)